MVGTETHVWSCETRWCFQRKENPFNSHKECKEQIVCGASIEVPHKLAGQGDSPWSGQISVVIMPDSILLYMVSIWWSLWSCEAKLRYVGVIQFVFHVLQLTDSIYTTKRLFCFSKSTVNHQQNRIENRTSPDLVMVIGSACLLTP